MDSLRSLVVRDDVLFDDTTAHDGDMNPTMVKLLIALFCLVLVGLSAITALFVIRSIRRKRAIKNQQLPTHDTRRRSGHRRLTITATPYGRHSPSISFNEKEHFLDDQVSTAPSSPVPQIHITFPEEEDKSGRRQSGRVVVVRITDNGGVGLEPYEEQDLPPYQQREGDNWKSLDLERMGGLKEKANEKQWS